MARLLFPAALLLAALLVRAEPAQTFEQAVAPLLEEYCLGCHTGRRAKGDVDLAAAARDDRELWRRVRLKLARRQMPPPDAEQPGDAARRRVIAWLDAHLGGKPGRVTIRRLNRSEYENTVRDLLGVAFDAGARFPADDVGYGFDNIGDVLSIPPLLMEKYLAAAEEIAARAVVDEDTGRPAIRRVEGADLKVSSGARVAGRAAFLFAPGEVFTSIRFPRDGEYVLRARAYGQQAGPDIVRMAFRIDGKNVSTVLVPAVEKEPGDYEARVRVKQGQRRFGAAFLNDYYRPNNPDPRERDRNMAVLTLEVKGPVDKPVYPESHRRLIPKPAPKENWAPYLRQIVGGLAARAWRRPVTSDELGRLLGAVERATPEGATFERRVRLAIVALLVSPNFLFRVELEPTSVRPLTDFELASRLSYFLWSSMPDDELFELAQKGVLNDETVLRAQVVRMLRDARASSLARNFATQWLQIRSLDEATPDATLFPGVDRGLKAAMRAETELVFEAILREDRSVWELIDADFTFVNERLAKHYGLPGVRGAHMRRVRLQGARRGGVLTHASVLTMTSNPTRTSPVKRGKWILEAILDDPPRPPPPGADQIDESPEAVAAASLRERLERHRKDPACATCHAKMDILGFGLENYDAVGRWREYDGKFPVDTKGTLPDGRSFQGPSGLKALLKADRAFLRSVAKHMVTYALGRGATPADEPDLDRRTRTLARDPRLSRLVWEIVRSDTFRTRRGDRVQKETGK